MSRDVIPLFISDVRTVPGGDMGGGDVHPPSHIVTTGSAGGCFELTKERPAVTSGAMDSSRWTEIYEGINQHLQKATLPTRFSFQGQALEGRTPPSGLYDCGGIRRARPEEITNG
ncbi:hypothetical protein Tco_1541530 [Tanacetum coccineum]